MSVLDPEIVELKASLVNSQKFSDIRFTFPSTENDGKEQTIFGHKAIWATNSVVFSKMFSGDFTVEKKIRIDDIKHEIFLELAKYIYTGVLHLTTLNMAGLLYTAQKYLLKDMKLKAEKFVLDNTSNANLLEIINASLSFENPAIGAQCLQLFCDNPLHFITDVKFLNLSAKAFKMIMDEQMMNCTDLQLKQFALKWLNKIYNLNVTEFRDTTYRKLLKGTGVEKWQLGPKSLFNVETIFNHGQFGILPFAVSDINVRSNKKTSLFGIGLYTGVFQDKEETATVYDKQNYFDDIITINVFQDQKNSEEDDVLKHKSLHTIKQNSAVSVHRIIFEKLELIGDFWIYVEFDERKARTVISNTIPAENADNNVRVNRTYIDEKITTTRDSCLAYLLTSTGINKN